jgi:hypothetical protein
MGAIVVESGIAAFEAALLELGPKSSCSLVLPASIFNVLWELGVKEFNIGIQAGHRPCGSALHLHVTAKAHQAAVMLQSCTS